MARASRRQAPKNNRVRRVDMSQAGQTRFTPDEDDYLVEISKGEFGESQSGNEQLRLDFTVIDGKHEGKGFPMWFSLIDTAIWKLAGVLRSAGLDIPEEEVELDLDEIEGRKLWLSIEHREWEGNTKPEVKDSWPAEEAEEEDEPPARGKKRSAKDEDEDEAPKSRRSAKKDEEEEEDEAPKSRRSSKSGKSKLKPVSGDEVAEMNQDELEELIEKYDLDVDLSDYSSLRKKIAAVIDALDGAGHLED